MTDARGGAPFFGLTAKQIYDQVTGGPGSDKLSDAQAASREEFDLEMERTARIAALASRFQNGWQGEAGAAAHGAAGPLADGARQGADHLGFTQQLHAQEVEVFHSVKNAVVPVPEHPPEPNILTQKYPWMEDFDQDVQNYQAAVQHNQDTFRVYDETGMRYESALAERQYNPITHSGGDLEVTNSSSSDGTIDSADYRQPTGSGTPGTGAGPFSVGADTPSSRSPGAGPVSAGGDPAGNAPAASTSASQLTPTTTPPPGTTSGAPSTATGVPGGPTAGSPVVGAAPATGGLGTGAGTGVGRGASTGGVSGRGAGVAGPGGPGVRGGVPGAGPGIGPGAPGTPGAAGGVGGAAAAGGRGAGMAGAPMGAGAGQGKGDDDEHERKYLRPIDAESTFGNEELTAPQVIGDDADEDQ